MLAGVADDFSVLVVSETTTTVVDVLSAVSLVRVPLAAGGSVGLFVIDMTVEVLLKVEGFVELFTK